MSTSAFPRLEAEQAKDEDYRERLRHEREERQASLDRTMAELTATALRVKAERDEAMRLLQRTLDIREMGSQGLHKTNIRQFLALVGESAIAQGRSAVRLDRMRAIEGAITQTNPDPQECVGIVHALQASLRYQYDAQAVDVDDALGEACGALEELERTLSTIDAADDAHDLERSRQP